MLHPALGGWARPTSGRTLPPCDTPVASPETFHHLRLESDPTQWRRHLGYPKAAVPSARARAEVERTLPLALGRLRPRGTYSVHALTARAEHSLGLGAVKIEGEVARLIGDVRRVAAFVVTVGEDIEQATDAACRDGQALAG